MNGEPVRTVTGPLRERVAANGRRRATGGGTRRQRAYYCCSSCTISFIMISYLGFQSSVPGTPMMDSDGVQSERSLIQVWRC